MRQRFPQAHIAALVFPTNAGVLHANEDIDEVILHPTGQTFTALNYLRFLRADAAPALYPGHRVPALRVVVERVCAACGAASRSTFPLYQWFFPFGARPWKDRHAITSYATVIRLLGLRVDPSRLVVRATERTATAMPRRSCDAQGIARRRAHHRPASRRRGVPRHETLGGTRALPCWATNWPRRHDARIVIVGGRDELAVGARGRRGHAPAGDRRSTGAHAGANRRLAGAQLSVRRQRQRAAAHGRLAGVPTVGIFGPTSLVNYVPVGPYVEVARSGIVCSPCFHFVGSHPIWAGSRCRVPTCLHTLAVDTVLAAAERALAQQRASG